MKLRASLSLVALCVGLASIVPIGAPSAFAQDDAITEVARQRYNEGVKAFDAGKYEDARSAFLQAYALKRHPAVLLNLGLSEARSNHPEDAGNHLQQFLREFTSASAEERATAEKAIADAKKKASRIIIAVDTMGADVSVDGALVGKSPVPDPVFVKPGKHVVVGQANGKTTTVTVETKLGQDASASLALGGGGATPVPVPTPEPTPTPTIPALPPTAPPSATTPPPIATEPPPIAPTSTTTEVPSERQPFFQWYTHKPLALAGTGLAIVGLAVGIGFGAAASSAASSANADGDQIRQHVAANNPPDPDMRAPCTESGSGDTPGYNTACSHLRSDRSAQSTDSALATVGFVAFGVGAAGTVIYALVDWLPGKKKDDAKASPLKHVAIAPVVTPGVRGLSIDAKF